MHQIKMITSGGQTGADLGALLGAREVGIPTGGWAPKGFKTERGRNLALERIFGLQESLSADYAPRTMKNIDFSDMTWLFMFTKSPGSLRTLGYCLEGKWKTIPNPAPGKVFWQDFSLHPVSVLFQPDIDFEEIKSILDIGLKKTQTKYLNIAGNRETVSPGIQDFVQNFVIRFFGDQNETKSL